MTAHWFTSLRGRIRRRLLKENGRPTRLTLWVSGVFAAYLILAGLVLPHVLRPVLEKQMSQALNSPCRVESVSFNPFTLKVTVTSIAIPYPGDNAGTFLRLGRLEVTPSVLSLFRLAPGIKALRLDDPVVDLTLFKSGELSPHLFLVGQDAAKAEPEKAAGEDERVFPFIIHDFSINNGTVTFRDQIRNATYVAENVNLAVPFASTLAADKDVAVQPQLNATMNGRPLVFAGETRPFSNSLRTEFTLKTDELDLPQFGEYIAPYTSLNLKNGTLFTSLKLRLSREADKPVEFALAGRAEIVGLEMTGPQGTVFKTARAGIDMENVLIGPRRVVINEVFLESPAVTARRAADGTVDWQKFFTPPKDEPVTKREVTLTAASGAAVRKGNATKTANAAQATAATNGTKAANATAAANGGKSANATAAKAVNGTQAAPPAGAASSGGAVEPEGPPPPLALILSKARIADGSVTWHDASVPGFAAYTVPGINVLFSDVSSVGEGKADFSVEFGEGPAKFEAKGKASVNPMRIEGAVNMDRMPLTPFSRYLTQAAGLSLDSAALGIKGDFLAEYGAKAQVRFSPAEISLNDASVSPAGGKTSLVTAKKLAVGDITADLAAKSVVVGKISGSGINAKPVRGKDGELILRGDAPAPAKAESVAPAPAAKAAPVAQAVPAAKAPAAKVQPAAKGKTAARAPAKGPAKAPAKTVAKAAPAKTAPAPAPGARAAAPAPQTAGSSGSAWQVTLASVQIDSTNISLTDQSLRTTAVLPLSDIKLTAANISTQPGKQWTANFAARPGKHGSLALNAKGTLEPLAVSFQFKADKADLTFLSPYVGETTDIALAEASLAVDIAGEVKAGHGGGMDINVSGDAGLQGVSLTENRKEFGGWGRLRAEKFHYRSAPKSTGTLSVGALTLNGPRLSVAIDKDGVNSIQRALRQVPAKAPEGKETKPAQAQPAAAPAAQAAPGAIPRAENAPGGKDVPAEPVGGFTSLTIGEISVTGGEVNLRDERLQPPYALKVDSIKTSLTKLSSDPASRGELTGGLRLNGSPVTLSGDMNPLITAPAGKFKVEIKSLDLAMFSQYSAKFTGYPIRKGEFSAEITAALTGQKLDVQNDLSISKLDFGDKDTTPGAPDMPVKMAVSLLSDLNGDISLSLPISGRLDDPQFRIGGIVAKVIANIMLKTVTSPFSLLGGIVGGTFNLLTGGGGPDLEHIGFAPGEDRLDDRALASLRTLAKALAKRPSIKLELTGVADLAEKNDMAQADALKKMRELKYDALPKGERGATTPDKMRVGPDADADEYAALLFKVYAPARFEKPMSGGQPLQQSTSEMMRQIRKNASYSDGDVKDLAEARAKAVYDELVRTDASLAKRITVSPPKVTPADDKDRKIDSYVLTKMK